jgi:hypothetical protein
VINISAATIDQTVAAFRALLGPRFAQLMGDFDPQSVKGLRAYHQHAASAHPFARWWVQLETDVLKTRARNAFVMSDTSVFLLDLYARLLDVKEDPQFADVMEKLVAPNQFFSTMFEVFIYSAYRQQGYPIVIVVSERQTSVSEKAQGRSR